LAPPPWLKKYYERKIIKYRVYSTHTEFFSNIVDADSPDEAKSIVEGYDLDECSFDSADFEVTSVEEIGKE